MDGWSLRRVGEEGRGQQANGRIVDPTPDREQHELTGTRSDEQGWKTTSRRERPNGPATHPFIDPVVRGGGDDPKRCVVTQIGCSGWAQGTTRPSRDGRKRLHFTSGKMIPSCGIVLHRTPGLCPSDRRSAPVNVLPVRMQFGPSCTACLCLAAASPGGEAIRHPPSPGDTRRHGGHRRPTER